MQEDFHIWLLAFLSPREENARRLPHLETSNFSPWSFSLTEKKMGKWESASSVSKDG
jgi:hypothetical protein